MANINIVEEILGSEGDLRRHVLERCLVEDYSKRINMLTPMRRLLFRMYFIDGYGMKEIALAFGVHPSSVGRRMKTILRQLQNQNQNQNQKGGDLEKPLAVV